MPDIMNIIEVKDVDEYNAIILYLFIVAYVVKVNFLSNKSNYILLN